MARKNIIAGEVIETKQALSKIDFRLHESINLPIKHCLCTLPELEISQITEIVSHPQALMQTSLYLDLKFHNIKTVEYQDTALAAYDLRIGKLSASSAVITTKEATMENNLKILAENISNIENNFTNFILISECKT
jgi:prephenate dehydratase